MVKDRDKVVMRECGENVPPAADYGLRITDYGLRIIP